MTASIQSPDGGRRANSTNCSLHDVLWRLLDIVNDPKPTQHLKGIIGDVDLPPAEALPGAMLVIVMVVMPAFTQSDQCKNQRVFARFTSLISALSKHMAERVDKKSGVVENHGAHTEAPQESWQPSKPPAGKRQDERRNKVVSVQEHKLRILDQVFHAFGIKRFVIRGQDPAHMRPIEALLLHRMDVFRLIGMLVMMPMVSRPPKCAFLR